MTDEVSPYVAWFRVIYLFNAWAISVVVATLIPMTLATGAGDIATVPKWVWLLPVVDGGAFALYFLLSGAIVEYLEQSDRSTPAVLSGIAGKLEAWDEAGRSVE